MPTGSPNHRGPESRLRGRASSGLLQNLCLRPFLRRLVAKNRGILRWQVKDGISGRKAGFSVTKTWGGYAGEPYGVGSELVVEFTMDS